MYLKRVSKLIPSLDIDNFIMKQDYIRNLNCLLAYRRLGEEGLGRVCYIDSDVCDGFHRAGR